MRQKKLTETICFKTTPENYSYLKMFGNINRKLNELVNYHRKSFEFSQQNLEFGSESFEADESVIGNPSVMLRS